MTSLTIIAIALAAVATGLIIASVILAGRQSTERRPGFITDQLGASPARARPPAPSVDRSCLVAMGGLMDVETRRSAVGVELELRLENGRAMRRAILTDVEAYDVGCSLIRLSQLRPTPDRPLVFGRGDAA